MKNISKKKNYLIELKNKKLVKTSEITKVKASITHECKKYN